MTRLRGGKTAQRSRWMVTAIILLGIVIFVFALVVYRLYLQRSWRGVGRFTVLRQLKTDQGDEFRFLSVDPVSGDAIELKLPNDLEIATLGGRGSWRLGVMSKLSGQYGRKWAGDSIADSLGLAYQGFDQDLGTWDRFMWWWLSRQKQFTSVDLSDTSLLEKNDTVDGNKVLGLSSTWDDKAREWFVSAGLVSEGINIRIVNSLGEPGMGTHAARVIEHAGLRVGQIDNDPTQMVDRCRIRAMGLSATLAFLKAQFGCEVVIDTQRVDILLILGSEYRTGWLGTR